MEKVCINCPFVKVSCRQGKKPQECEKEKPKKQ